MVAAGGLMAGLTHFDASGAAQMADVSGKDETVRRAVARGSVAMRPETLALVMAGTAAKGDVLGVARLAGIMAAKRTAELIPLCHPLPLDGIAVDLALEGDALRIEATVRCTGRTGVEMEALTAASVAALTVYDMLKALSHDLVIERTELVAKSGGRSGDYRKY
jgi:cyclic pyranopterin phosphate synthase